MEQAPRSGKSSESSSGKTETPYIRPKWRESRWLLLALALFFPFYSFAQNPSGAGGAPGSLPDSPQPKQQDAPSSRTGRTSPFIGYITNKSFIFPDIATKPRPLSTVGKLELFVNQSISPPYVLVAGVDAAVSQARNVPEAYGQGWDAYGSRYGAAIARASSNSFFSTFLFASVLRQDPRFFPQSHPTFLGSVTYSAQQVFVTRSDSGRNVFNASGLFGPLAAETLANAYLPASEQTGAKTAERYGTDLAWKFAGNMFKDYWPTIFRSLGLKRLRVIPDPSSPDRPANQPRN
jgi:hypothetical protein